MQAKQCFGILIVLILTTFSTCSALSSKRIFLVGDSDDELALSNCERYKVQKEVYLNVGTDSKTEHTDTFVVGNQNNIMRIEVRRNYGTGTGKQENSGDEYVALVNGGPGSTFATLRFEIYPKRVVDFLHFSVLINYCPPWY